MKRIIFKSKISIDKDSKRGYLDERTGELSINEVVETYTSVTLLTTISLLFNLLLLMYSFQHIEPEISIVMD